MQIRHQIYITVLIETSKDQSDLRWTIQEYDEISIKWPTGRGYMSVLTRGLTGDE
jgi:hypothetical protein